MTDRRVDPVRLLALSVWCLGAWILLTWTRTLEQLGFGAVLAVLTALLLAPLGEVARPWKLLAPRRVVGMVRLVASGTGRIVVANLSLARRIWDPRRPLSSGMVIVPTEKDTDGTLAAVGLITSLIVDNQIVDVDRRRHALQYHAVSAPEGEPEEKRARMNGPVERLLEGVE